MTLPARVRHLPPATDRVRGSVTHPEAGSVTLFVVVAVLALFAVTGLVVDGGGKIRAAQRAHAAAEEAARAGGQAVAPARAVRGQRLTADPARAAAAARGHLSAARIAGTVRTTGGGATLVVHTTATHHPVFLAAFGVGPMTVHATATARLVRGVDQGEPR